MDYKDRDKERTDPEMKGRNPKLDLEGPNPNKPLFSENDRDPEVESNDWNYESLF